MGKPTQSVRFRAALLITCLLAAAPALVLTAARLAPFALPTPLVQLVSFTPYLILPLTVAFVAALALRKRFLILTVAVGMALQLLWLVPAALPSGPAADGARPTPETVEAMSVNALYGSADAADIVNTVESAGIDILVIVEFSAELSAGLDQAGLELLLPHTERRAEQGPGGSAIYARYPLENVRELPDTTFSMQQATVSTPTITGTTPLLVTAVHTYPPFPGRLEDWRSDFNSLGRSTASAAPQLYLGDFNATLDHRPYRQFLAQPEPDLIDAAQHLGRRLQPSWPTGPLLPPMLTLDHIVVSPGISVHDFRMQRISGTDHMATLASISL